MKQPPRNASFAMTQMSRVDFLTGVLRRLQDDVGNILSLIDSHNVKSIQSGNRVIGFWAELRMILPIIEAVSHAMNMRPQEILGNHLNITTPDLMWDLFRHSIIHGDTLQEGTYNGKNVSWGVGVGLGSHVISNGHIGIDAKVLYDDLVNYLQGEIANNDQTLIDIETGVEYGTRGNARQEIIDDFLKL